MTNSSAKRARTKKRYRRRLNRSIYHYFLSSTKARASRDSDGPLCGWRLVVSLRTLNSQSYFLTTQRQQKSRSLLLPTPLFKSSSVGPSSFFLLTHLLLSPWRHRIFLSSHCSRKKGCNTSGGRQYPRRRLFFKNFKTQCGESTYANGTFTHWNQLSVSLGTVVSFTNRSLMLQ